MRAACNKADEHLLVGAPVAGSRRNGAGVILGNRDLHGFGASDQAADRVGNFMAQHIAIGNAHGGVLGDRHCDQSGMQKI